jgi:hypothetical protein
MGAREPLCSEEIVGTADRVKSSASEGVLGVGVGEPDVDGESLAPPNPSSSA